MKPRTRTVSPVLLLLLALEIPRAEAAVLLASYGTSQQDETQQSFYMIEAASTKGGMGDFEVASLYHVDKRTINDYSEFIYRGLGFDFAVLRLNFDIGYFFSLDKYALDEIDYSVARSILGGGLNVDLKALQLRGFSRSYVPTKSRQTTIDSFDLSYNPYPYQQSQAGLSIRLGSLEINGDLGRFDKLKARYDILGDNYTVDLQAVTYAKAALVLKGGNHSVLRLEGHKILEDHNQRLEFHKFIGTAMHRDAYDGGSLGIGLEF